MKAKTRPFVAKPLNSLLKPQTCVHSQIQAQEIEVGDLVWLHENDEIPCDLVLLGTAEPMGLCYIEVSFYVDPLEIAVCSLYSRVITYIH